ncbi:MAG TPA: AAA family ATPase, partial [Streptosporangiaceae bacterium]|nr:AAA family ATPase [Streptosporangiaceae bacterium]
MSLAELTVTNVRCLKEAQLEVPSGLTLIWGGNGSGKTSLLEAVFLLGRGRSFRTRNTERLITRGSDHMRVVGRLSAGSGGSMVIGVELAGEGVTARIGGRTAGSLAELSQAFPVQAIEPGVHRLVEEGGAGRRRWMDWAAFHVEPQFVDTWVRYTRALKQRNAALKTDPTQAPIWDGELARLGEIIAGSRGRLLKQLEPYWVEAMSA